MAVMWIGRQVRCKLPPLLFSQVSSAHRLLTFWTQFRSVRHTLGVRLWRHDLSARLHIGPLDEAQAQGFLPGGVSLAVLEEMASLFAIPTLRYEVLLLLAPPCVKRLTLSTRTAPRQLGWNTFLTATPGVTSRPDIRSALRLPGRTSSGRPPMPGLAKVR
jgi:hypothetical protein